MQSDNFPHLGVIVCVEGPDENKFLDAEQFVEVL